MTYPNGMTAWAVAAGVVFLLFVGSFSRFVPADRKGPSFIAFLFLALYCAAFRVYSHPTVGEERDLWVELINIGMFLFGFAWYYRRLRRWH